MDCIDTMIARMGEDGTLRVYIPGTPYYFIPLTEHNAWGFDIYRQIDPIESKYQGHESLVSGVLAFVREQQYKQERARLKEWGAVPA